MTTDRFYPSIRRGLYTSYFILHPSLRRGLLGRRCGFILYTVHRQGLLRRRRPLAHRHRRRHRPLCSSDCRRGRGRPRGAHAAPRAAGLRLRHPLHRQRIHPKLGRQARPPRVQGRQLGRPVSRGGRGAAACLGPSLGRPAGRGGGRPKRGGRGCRLLQPARASHGLGRRHDAGRAELGSTFRRSADLAGRRVSSAASFGKRAVHILEPESAQPSSQPWVAPRLLSGLPALGAGDRGRAASSNNARLGSLPRRSGAGS